MTDSDFDIIFEDIMEADEASRQFLQILEELLPEASHLMILANGTVLEGGRRIDLSVSEREKLVNLTRKEGSCIRRGLEKARDCYGTLLPGFEAVLLTIITLEAANGDEHRETRALLDNTIELAVLKQHHEALVIEKEQSRKQINILKKQHDRLIEDNYRQYRLNQEKEKEYARKLESEIAGRTAELREANSRLQEISRLKSDFLANMSHELRTPMNAIIGFADLLLETRLDNEQGDYIQTIKQSAGSLLALINDILDLARVEAGKLKLEKKPFDLPHLVVNVTDMFRIQILEKGLDIKYEIDDRVPVRVLGDSNRLRQVLVNLTGNAVKFTDKGNIAIQVNYQGMRRQRNLIRFMVTDTGIGIAEDRIYAVFDNFTQADGSTTREYGGTGLGLSICQELVGLMEGNILVHSEPGLGSIFCFVIPFDPADSEESRESEPDPEILEKVAGPGERVLIVEDNPVNQRLAKIILEKLGYEVDVASDGVEALERLKHQEFDLVFMDVQMPNLDGREVTKRIRKSESDPLRCEEFVSLKNRTSPLKIVGLTAHARKEDEELCYESGMDAFLSKPLVKEKLVRLLAEIGKKG